MSCIHLGIFLNVFLGFYLSDLCFYYFQKDSCVFNVYASITHFLPLR